MQNGRWEWLASGKLTFDYDFRSDQQRALASSPPSYILGCATGRGVVQPTSNLHNCRRLLDHLTDNITAYRTTSPSMSLSFNPDKELPDINGKVVFITGGSSKTSRWLIFVGRLTHLLTRDRWSWCIVSPPTCQASPFQDLFHGPGRKSWRKYRRWR